MRWVLGFLMFGFLLWQLFYLIQLGHLLVEIFGGMYVNTGLQILRVYKDGTMEPATRQEYDAYVEFEKRVFYLFLLNGAMIGLILAFFFMLAKM